MPKRNLEGEILLDVGKNDGDIGGVASLRIKWGNYQKKRGLLFGAVLLDRNGDTVKFNDGKYERIQKWVKTDEPEKVAASLKEEMELKLFQKLKRKHEEEDVVVAGPGSRQSKRARTQIDTTNMGPECLYRSRQVGSAHSPLSSVTSKSDLEKHAATLLNIQNELPEHKAAIQDVVQFMRDQDYTIDLLSKALESVRDQMKSLFADLNLNEEAKEAIEVMQSGVLAILALLDLDGDDLSDGGTASISSPLSAASPASTSSSSGSAATAKTTGRERNAAELRSNLRDVYRLANRGKTQEARAALAKIPNGKNLHKRSIEIAAKAMEDLLLERGGLETVRRVLDMFFDRPIIRTAMSEHLKEKAQPSDRETIDAMLVSIKHFFTGTMVTRGRRTDLDRNVFYAAAAAVIPKSARENRQMRAVMRLTGLRHDAVQKAIDFRVNMDDHKRGWTLLKTAKHKDAIDFAPLDSWFHSSAASTEDNENKKEVRVRLEEKEGTITYQLHNRRYLKAKLPILYQEFKQSPEFADMKRDFEDVELQKRRNKAVKQLKRKLCRDPSDAEVLDEEEHLGLEYQTRQARTLAKRAKRKLGLEDQEISEADIEAQMGNAAKLPQLILSLGTFRKKKCKCTVYRHGGDCDCTLCTYVMANLRKFKIDINRWHSAEGHDCVLECNDSSSAFRLSLDNVSTLQRFLLCDRIEVPALTCCRSSGPFKIFKRNCVTGTCLSFKSGGSTLSQRNCGWHVKAPRCSLLWNNSPHVWYRYEPTQVGTNKDTMEPIMSEEFRPVFGTRKEFIKEFIAKFELFVPHKQDDRLQRNNLWLSMEHIMTEKENPTIAMILTDYAAQFEVVRWTTPTCGVKSSHNNCVMMISCKPEEVKKVVRKWGKRKASVENVTKNYCAVVYGMFSNRSKPSAHHYNMQYEDLVHFMKFGFTIHGEWFLRGLRIQRKRRGVAELEELPQEPANDDERSAVDDSRVSIWFRDQKDFYSGSVRYDIEFIEEMAKEQRTVEEDDNGYPLHYLITYDDGDIGHVSWLDVQVGIRNYQSSGFIDVAHQYPLPSGTFNTDTDQQWTLRDATASDLASTSCPIFPELKDTIEDTDGCGGQFQGQTNAGRVARSASSAIGVRRKSVIGIAGHGKNHCDHQGFTMSQNVKQLTLSSEAPVLSGTRSVVLALAQHRQEPTQTHESKCSPWAPRDVIYGFYDDKLLDRRHEQFTPYKNSKLYHSRTGTQTDSTKAETLGALDVNRIHCACANCKAPKYDFRNCLVKEIVGVSRKVQCKRLRGMAPMATQTQALADFSLRVKKDSCWPVRVAEDQEGAEGPFWLAMIVDDPERLEKSITYAGQVFKEGWIVVKARYYSFLRESGPEADRTRVYTLLEDETYLSLNHLARLERPVTMKRDKNAKSKPKPWLLTPKERAIIEAAL